PPVLYPFSVYPLPPPRLLHSFPTRRSSDLLLSSAMTASSPYWLVDDDIRDTECLVQIRAHGDAVPGRVRRSGAGAEEMLEITLDEPVRGVAPGQAAVLYRAEPDGDRVLGSGTITAGA